MLQYVPDINKWGKMKFRPYNRDDLITGTHYITQMSFLKRDCAVSWTFCGFIAKITRQERSSLPGAIADG